MQNGLRSNPADTPIVHTARVEVPAAGAALSRRQVTDVLKKYWGFGTLRPNQEDAIRANLEGRDSLLVMPTGGGKSLCYQLPPLLTDRLTVVVSPLIALIKDQVDGLRIAGVPAAGLYTGMDPAVTAEVWSALGEDRLRLLFMAPERLLTPGTLSRLAMTDGARGPRCFAIDEAHCISQWGHDFRPEYRRMSELREVFPRAAFHAFTATATPRVRDDIARQLKLREPEVIVGTFDRPNLTYRVIPKADQTTQIADAIRRHSNGGVIVYCISRKSTEDLCTALKSKKIHAEPYHAGMDAARRGRVQEAFAREDTNVIVATVAFGMGIDRSNVRCVVHAAMPKSIEHYQQETGRAGRDGLAAECLMLYSAADAMKWNSILERGAEESGATREHLRHQKDLVEEVRRFATVSRCRHEFLSNYFGQPYTPPPNENPADVRGCGACDVCLGDLELAPESTVIAQKILSCVFRIFESSGLSFGSGHVADVLLGRKIATVLDRGHDRLSTFGLLKSTPRARITSFIDQLSDLGLLARAEGQYPTLVLTGDAREVLRGRKEVKLFVPKELASTDEAVSSEEGELFEVLRAVRREAAAERGIPAYQVFGDVVLRAMASSRPTRAESLRAISGIGERKAADFGPRFLHAITAHCETHKLQTDLRQRGAPAPTRKERKSAGTTARADAYAEQFRKGRSVEEIAESLNVRESRVCEQLANYIEDTRPADIDRWIDPRSYAIISLAASAVGLNRLKPVMDQLERDGQRFSYDEIRLVVSHLRATAKSE